jgi:predicted acetyltransferase
MPIEVRPITEDELPAMLEIDRRGFGQPPRPPERADSWTRAELDRTQCAFDAGDLIGCTRAYTFELTMPGSAFVPVAAISAVAVSPTHRRRGVLTAMMGALHDDARARGEIAAVLTASEGIIYGRFGYGPATWRLGASIDRAGGRFARPVGDPGRVRLVTRGEADLIFQRVYEDARRARAGAVSRPEFWWPEVFWQTPSTEPGRAFFDAVHEDEHGRPDGYVAYEIKGEWQGGVAARQAYIWDLQATNPTARAALWEFLFGIDLIVSIAAHNLPPDEPLRFLLADSRKLRTDFLIDSVWVLPLDVAALLAGRTYTTSGKLVIEVVDPGGSRTRVSLDGGPDGARGADQSSAVPDLSCSRATLGALSLGGSSWATLAAAGAVDEHTPGAIALADAMFATTPAPATVSWF